MPYAAATAPRLAFLMHPQRQEWFWGFLRQAGACGPAGAPDAVVDFGEVGQL